MESPPFKMGNAHWKTKKQARKWLALDIVMKKALLNQYEQIPDARVRFWISLPLSLC
jgi:hypothetical protein